MTSPTAPPLNPDELLAQEETPVGVQQDYFGFAATDKYVFPDGITYIDLKVMNEGTKSEFQKRTQRDVVLEKGSGNARFRMDPAEERHELIRKCATGWNLVRGGVLTPFTERNLNDWLKLTDPELVEQVEKKIRKMNPWLQGEMTSDDIRQQIKELEEQLEIALEREQEKAGSSAR